MGYQKTPLRSAINVYTPKLDAYATQQKRCRLMLHRTASALQRKSSVEMYCLSDYVMRTRPPQRLDAATPAVRWRNKQKHVRETIMETPTKQIPTASGDIVKLIRKLRWAGLEERAELLEKELEQHAVTDTVVSMQNETD
jgi:hypothetical protein